MQPAHHHLGGGDRQPRPAAPFSDYGATSVDLAAPGVSIRSTLPGGTYGYLSGTSMAAPQVSGAAALVLSAEPTLTTAQLEARLLGAVDLVPALAGRTVTGGRLDVCRAVTGCATRGASSVSLTTSGNAGVGVAAVVLTAGIGPGSATGTVAFRDGGVAVPGCAAVPVSGGRAQCVTTFATAGAHPITTADSGDGVLLPATAATTVDVTATPNLFQLLLGVVLRFAATSTCSASKPPASPPPPAHPPSNCSRLPIAEVGGGGWAVDGHGAGSDQHQGDDVERLGQPRTLTQGGEATEHGQHDQDEARPTVAGPQLGQQKTFHHDEDDGEDQGTDDAEGDGGVDLLAGQPWCGLGGDPISGCGQIAQR